MINKSAFAQQKFKSQGIQENPIGEADMEELRTRLKDKVVEKFELYRVANKAKISDYSFVQKFCGIPEDAYKKTISGKNRLSRSFIAKLAVGLKLDVDEANTYFEPHSGELSMTNAFDFIVFHSLNDADDVETLVEEVQKYLNINLNK